MAEGEKDIAERNPQGNLSGRDKQLIVHADSILLDLLKFPLVFFLLLAVVVGASFRKYKSIIINNCWLISI